CKAYGIADATHNVLNRTETTFRVASLTKTFTAAATILLLNQGKLHLDDPLSRFLPDFPNGEHITVEHLLLHQAGVGTLDEPKFSHGALSLNTLVQQIKMQPPLFPPGTDGRYSNEGYLLLAAVIEKVSGMSYAEYLKRNIFDPLGMRSTGNFEARWTI